MWLPAAATSTSTHLHDGTVVNERYLAFLPLVRSLSVVMVVTVIVTVIVAVVVAVVVIVILLRI
jgi:hypothetical protein